MFNKYLTCACSASHLAQACRKKTNPCESRKTHCGDPWNEFVDVAAVAVHCGPCFPITDYELAPWYDGLGQEDALPLPAPLLPILLPQQSLLGLKRPTKLRKLRGEK